MSDQEVITWITFKMLILIMTIVAVCGAFAVSRGKSLGANFLWIISNPFLAIYNYTIYQYEMAGMFTIYSLIAIYGIWNLKFRKTNENETRI